MCRKLICLLTFILVLSIASNASADLVAHWRFDEGSGSTAFDSVGGHDGTLEGDPQWVAGQVGSGALEFDGTGDYVDCGSSPDYEIPVNITVACWIKVDVFDTTWQAIITTSDNSWRLHRSGDTNNIAWGTSGLTPLDLTGSTDVSTGDWFHVAGVYDGAQKLLYINGEIDATSDSTGNITTSTMPVFIGDNSQNTGRHWAGLIDDVRIYNNALTQADIQSAMLGEGYPFASSPTPEDGSIYPDTWVSVSWRAGDFAASHDVYFGDNFDDVNDGTRDSEVFRINQDLKTNYYFAGFFGGAYPEGLINGTTYYWRIDEVNDADPNSPWKGKIWSFTVPPKIAYNPVPGDNAAFVDADNPTLTWTPGFGARFHSVYFGDDYDTVANAAGAPSTPLGTYNPGTLELEKTYYWRVDESDGATTYTGDVWSFKTAKEGGGIRGDYYNGMNFETHMLTRIDPEINFNWGDPGGPDPAVGDNQFSCRWTGEVEAAYTETYTFYGAADDGVRLWVDGVQLVNAWVDQGTTEYNGTIDLVAGNSYSIVMEQYENGGGATAYLRWSSPSTPKQIIPQAALSPPIKASSPSPSNGATGTKMTPILRWGVGDFAASHEVYFGTDADAVRNADKSSPEYKGNKVLGDETYNPGKLAWFTQYFWRIDEVNAVNPDSPWIGNLWNFTTGDFLVVDDFEDYDAGDNQIWFFWHDGLGAGAPGMPNYVPGNGTGSAVGDETTLSYTEETIVHGGNQSMPLTYDNNKSGFAFYSETELTLIAPRDWTEEGVANLSLWFRGYPASVGSFVEGPTGTYTMTGSGADIWDSADEFHFAYKMLSGIGTIVARVESVDPTNNWAKAGVMIRETLEPGSKHATTVVTPAQGVSFQRRAETDNTSLNTDVTGLVAPYWVKIERDIAGNFTGSSSADGSTWEMIGVWENIQMGANVYIGLAVTSHDTALTCQAVFSNVTTTGNVTGQWTNQDIGILSNDAEPLYVAVSNSTGTSAVVVHDDSAAATIDTWTEWVIPLQTFVDKGIVLTNVDRIAIGLGTRDNVTIPGGSGKMFIDDIRLYQPAPEPAPEP